MLFKENKFILFIVYNLYNLYNYIINIIFSIFISTKKFGLVDSYNIIIIFCIILEYIFI